MFKDILFSVEKKIATITLNLPSNGNALSDNMFIEIPEALAECSSRDDIGAVVLTGAGKHFSTGGNISDLKRFIDEKTYLAEDTVLMGSEATYAIRQCSKPVIAMVNGAAAGGGCCFALACDFRLATPKSVFCMAFINIGLTGDGGANYWLSRLIGMGQATHMLMTGDKISGQTALNWGLVTELFDEGDLISGTYKFAEKLANGPILAYKMQKEIINKYFYPEIEVRGLFQNEAKAIRKSSMSADHAEAINAFLEKRTPKFIGK